MLLSAAAWGLRVYWRSAAVLVTVLAAALAVVLAVASAVMPHYPVLAPRFDVTPVTPWDTGQPWSSLARAGTTFQWQAMIVLFQSLAGQTAGLAIVAMLAVVGVSIARARGRAGEVATRRAVGATRRAVVSTALVETGVLATMALLLGGTAGLVTSREVMVGWQGPVWPTSPVPILAVVVATLVVLGFDAALTAAPAWRRVLPPPLSTTPGLAVAALQLGVSLIALAGGDVFARRLGDIAQPEGAAAANGSVYEWSAPGLAAPARAKVYTAALGRLAADTSVDGASLGSPGLRVGLGVVDVATADCGHCRIGTIPMRLLPVAAAHFLVSADTFRMLGLNVITGRALNGGDGWGARPVAVVSRSLARGYFEGGQAVGRAIRIGGQGPPRWYTVVGVVDDRVPEAFGGADAPRQALYLSVLQHPAERLELFVRARASSPSTAIRGLALAQVSRGSEAEVLSREAEPLRWFGRAFKVEGWVTLGVAWLGTCALMLIWVTSIRGELGTRRAVGATRRRVMGYVLVRAAVVGAAGVVIALWLGDLVWGAITSVVPGVPELSATTLVRLSAMLVLAAVVGAALPGWQIVRAAPASLTAPGD
jgi:hypothetical protein